MKDGSRAVCLSFTKPSWSTSRTAKKPKSSKCKKCDQTDQGISQCNASLNRQASGLGVSPLCGKKKRDASQILRLPKKAVKFPLSLEMRVYFLCPISLSCFWVDLGRVFSVELRLASGWGSYERAMWIWRDSSHQPPFDSSPSATVTTHLQKRPPLTVVSRDNKTC